MEIKHAQKIFFLALGDIVALYLALFAMLLVRYGGAFYASFVNLHVLPFTIVFVPWIAIFYVAGLYDLRRLRNNLDFLKILWLSLAVNAVIAVLFFYLIPIFGITPKTNLFIFIVIFAVIETYWRRIFNRTLAGSEAANRVLLVGANAAAEEARRTIDQNPQLGYAIAATLAEADIHADPRRLEEAVQASRANLVVVPRELKYDTKLNKTLYDFLGSGIEVRDTVDFYEAVMRKIPVVGLEESWFLENVIDHHRFYDDLKRAGEFLFSLALLIVLSPILALIAIFVKLTSRGPVVFKQVRTGRYNKKFTLYKFRSMRADAEKYGAQWKASGTKDPRLTSVGRFLVLTHLDELLQLANILKGQMSFVGPRPERPELVAVIKEKVPYFEIRHLVKPGVTGWAQINFRYGATVEDSREKLEYDIYYVKNRSIILDIAIVLKTIKSFFVNQK